MTTATNDSVGVAPKLISVKVVAQLLGCSEKHVRCLNAAGRMPRPIHLLSSVKWHADEISKWIDAGCPPRDRWEATRRK